ncbi:MAG: VWA domain-containing protein [Propionibacterium sp.]|nr:VWA domain-containing protein [Propionibacterium sp.]
MPYGVGLGRHRTGTGRLQSVVIAWVIAIISLLLGSLQALQASAAPRQATLSTVLSALSISPQPSDYVVIVDTSASMQDGGRYQLVRSALTRMAHALNADDRVAVITFDTVPHQRRGLTAVGSNPDSIVSSLPATAVGQGTDIGSAIGAALDLMQGANLRQRVAVMLMTDGRIDTPASSTYATVNSPGWNTLHQRAAALQMSHDIAPLAIALTSNTDAAVLKEVFSDVTDVPAANLGDYLAQVSNTVMKAAAVTRLKPHMAAPIEASISGLSSPATGTRKAVITLHNSNPVVPVQVAGLGLTANSRPAASVSGLPSSVDIPAGGSATIDIQVSPADHPGTTATYLVTGTVTTPWQTVITKDLGLTWAGKLSSSTAVLTQPSTSPSPSPAAGPVATSRSTPSWWPMVAGLAVVAAALAVAAWAVRQMARPPLVGTVSVLRNGAVIEERLLRGREMSVALSNPTVSILLTATRNDQREPGVHVRVTSARNHTNGTLFEAQTFEAEGLTVTYTTDRTRMLRLIGTD